MQSRELKCFNKIVSVCKNRGLVDLADDILNMLGPKYLEKEEVKHLVATETPKVIKYADKTSFLEATNFANKCTKCDELVEQGTPAFLQGKKLYHVLCGTETLNEPATDNFYYKRWLMKSKDINIQEVEDEAEI
jgi:hypothetical protein